MFDPNRPEISHYDGHISFILTESARRDTVISFRFVRYASWPLPNGTVAKEQLVTTWERMVRFDGQADQASIQLNLDHTLDEFIKAYLKANE